MSEDVIVPPIHREEVNVQAHILKVMRAENEALQKQRDALEKLNNDYRRMIFALIAQAGGEVRLTRATLVNMPIGGTILSESDARDGSVRVWSEGA